MKAKGKQQKKPPSPQRKLALLLKKKRRPKRRKNKRPRLMQMAMLKWKALKTREARKRKQPRSARRKRAKLKHQRYVLSISQCSMILTIPSRRPRLFSRASSQLEKKEKNPNPRKLRSQSPVQRPQR